MQIAPVIVVFVRPGFVAGLFFFVEFTAYLCKVVTDI